MQLPSGLKTTQIKAARALLNLSQEELAKVSGLSIATVHKLEVSHVSPRGKTQSMLPPSSEDAGLECLEPDGLRHRPEEISIYHSHEKAIKFLGLS